MFGISQAQNSPDGFINFLIDSKTTWDKEIDLKPRSRMNSILFMDRKIVPGYWFRNELKYII